MNIYIDNNNEINIDVVNHFDFKNANQTHRQVIYNN